MLLNTTIAKMFVLRVEMYKLCSAIYRTTLFTTLIDLDIQSINQSKTLFKRGEIYTV